MIEPSSEVPRRKRGRPPGATRYKEADGRLMALVGDKLLTEPHLTTRAAIVQVIIRARGKQDDNTLRRIQDKLDRDLVVKAAAERQKKEHQRREEMLRGFLALAEFRSGGPNFQRFVAKPEVQGLIRDTVVLTQGMNAMAQGLASYLFPPAQAARQLILMAAPHLEIRRQDAAPHRRKAPAVS